MSNKVFFIAEAGINHNGDLNKAKKLVDIAIRAGADAVKFQFFKSKELSTIKSKKADYQKKGKVDKSSQFDLLNKNELSESNLLTLKKYCQGKIHLMVTPFDFQSLNFLKKKNFKYIKISSGDNDNYLFIKKIAETKKNIFLSTGMISNKNLDKTIKIFKSYNIKPKIFHCVSLYPTRLEFSNLSRIKELKNKYPRYEIGYSDHTCELETPSFAVMCGAKLIEKHFTYNKKASGPDHIFSLSPQELKKSIDLVRVAEKCLSRVNKNLLKNFENKIVLVSKKRILAKKNIKKGEKITENNIVLKRNNSGKFASEIFNLLNTKAKKNIKENEEV